MIGILMEFLLGFDENVCWNFDKNLDGNFDGNCEKS